MSRNKKAQTLGAISDAMTASITKTPKRWHVYSLQNGTLTAYAKKAQAVKAARAAWPESAVFYELPNGMFELINISRKAPEAPDDV